MIHENSGPTFTIEHDGTITGLNRVAGIDISFVPDTNLAYVAIAILSFPDLRLVRLECEAVQIDVPYIPGYLAFRELPAIRLVLTDLLKKLQSSQDLPQVFLVDGNGQMHPRAAGIASHLGVIMNIPTIGCSKSFFRMDGLTDRIVGETITKELLERQEMQPCAPVIGVSGVTHGYAMLNGKRKTKNPIFVSVGHRVDLPSSLHIVKACSVYRVPEPIRLADKLSRKQAQAHVLKTNT